MLNIADWPRGVATDLAAQLIVAGIIVLMTWIGGMLGQLPGWAYVPLTVATIGLTFWAINRYAETFQRLVIKKPFDVGASSQYVAGSVKNDGQYRTLNTAMDSRRLMAARAESFANQEIHLHNLVTDDNLFIQDCVFDSCIITGPAVILPASIKLLPTTRFWPTADISDVLIPAEPNRRLSGIIGLKNCTFKNCTFKNIGIIGGQKTLDNILQVFRGGESG